MIREVSRTSPQRIVFPAWRLPWQSICAMVWADASQGNRPNKSSTVGILGCLGPDKILENEGARTGSEVQSIAMGEDQVFLLRAMWYELHGGTISRYDLSDNLCQYTKGGLVMDSKGVCRRKNIACPRYVSWLSNQSQSALSASLFLHAMKPMYDLLGWDVWTYYAARFGIGDVYFCAISWGKLEVIEDPMGIKRLSHHALHCDVLCEHCLEIDVQCILKLLGFVGDPSNDRVMKVKEMVGFWVNEDPRRYLVAEPVSVMATNFGGVDLLPEHGTQTGVFIGSIIPFLMERGAIHSQIKIERMWTLHPVDKFIQYCKEDWDHYCEKFSFEGLTGPQFPYTPEQAHKYLNMYREENRVAAKEQAPFYEEFVDRQLKQAQSDR
eukprot:s2874_g1.t1